MVNVAHAVRLDVHEGADEHPFWLCGFADGERGGWGVHRHEQHQMAWVARGTATVVAPGGAWIATSARAIWVPSNCPHDIHLAAGCELVCFYVWPDHCPLDWADPTEVAVTPLVRALMTEMREQVAEHAVPEPYAAVLFEQLARQTPPGRPTLPMPVDERAVDVALGILDDPGSTRTLDDWAKAVAASPSTLRRAFMAETSLSFTEWRARARLDAALPLLARGLSTEQVALRVGYASRSGFVDAYRRHFGHPPEP